MLAPQSRDMSRGFTHLENTSQTWRQLNVSAFSFIWQHMVKYTYHFPSFAVIILVPWIYHFWKNVRLRGCISLNNKCIWTKVRSFMCNSEVEVLRRYGEWILWFVDRGWGAGTKTHSLQCLSRMQPMFFGNLLLAVGRSPGHGFLSDVKFRDIQTEMH